MILSDVLYCTVPPLRGVRIKTPYFSKLAWTRTSATRAREIAARTNAGAYCADAAQH